MKTPLCSAPQPLAPSPLPPQTGLRLTFLAGLGLRDRDFLRRKGKGLISGGWEFLATLDAVQRARAGFIAVTDGLS